MPRFKLTLEYDGAPFVGWQRQENGLSVQEALEGALVRHDGRARDRPWRGAHRRRRPCAGPGRACRPRARLGAVPARRGAQRAASPHPIAVLKSERVGGRFRRPAQRRGPPLSLSHRQPPRAAGARARPRLAGEAAPRRARRCTRPRRRWSAGTISPPFATRNARRNRRSAPSTGSTSCATATRFTSKRARCSFLHRQVRSMVGSLVEVGAGPLDRGATSRPRSKPPTAAAAARSPRPAASTSPASTMPVGAPANAECRAKRGEGVSHRCDAGHILPAKRGGGEATSAAPPPPRFRGPLPRWGRVKRPDSPRSREAGEVCEIALERALVDPRQRFEIVERDPLVDRVDGGVDEAELDHRAGVLDEARVGRAAAGRKLRPPPGHVLDRARRRDR